MPVQSTRRWRPDDWLDCVGPNLLPSFAVGAANSVPIINDCHPGVSCDVMIQVITADYNERNILCGCQFWTEMAQLMQSSQLMSLKSGSFWFRDK